jgi:hypothetical protein
VKDSHLLFFASFAWRTRLRVKSGQTITGENPLLSAVAPIADKRGRGWIVR